MEREQWPPLEQVREWAARKLVSGQVVPSSTGRYVNLIALIDEILVSQATAAASTQSELASDGEEPEQNTPGRPKSASSRQQSAPAQATQTGSTKLDAEAAGR